MKVVKIFSCSLGGSSVILIVMLLVIDSNRYDHLYLLSYARNDTLTVSFPIYFSLIFFICLVLAKSSSIILNRYGQSRQLALCLSFVELF